MNKNATVLLLTILLLFYLKPVHAGLLLIESYHAEYPWDISYKKGITSILGDKYQIDYFQMDTKRIPTSQFDARANAAWDYYQRHHPELVFLADDNALRLVGPRLATTMTPVVYLGINGNPRQYGLIYASNITGVLERPRLNDAIYLLGKLFTDTHPKILVLLDSGVTSSVIFNEVFKRKEVSIEGVNRIDVRQIKYWDDWQSEVINAKENGYTAIIPALYHTITNHQGQYIDAEKIILWTSAHTPVPPFAFWDFAVGKNKTIGGIVLFGESQGKTAAKIALQILNGRRPSTILPTVAEEGRYLFSRTQLTKWHLDKHPFVLKHAEYT